MAVIGAGISGLAVTRALLSRGVDAILFEASARPGGVIRSSRHAGVLLEWGPQRLRLTPAVRSLVDELGLASRLRFAPVRARLHVFRADRLHPVPRSLPDLAAATLLSPAGRLRVLAEPLTRPVEPAETVGEALTRKFGREAYEALLGPLFGGLYATDPHEMRSRDSLSRFLVSAGTPRSLLLHGLGLARRGADLPAASFDEGMAVLPEALGRALGPALRLEHPVRHVRRDGGGWRVEPEEAGASPEGPFEAVVLCVPAAAAGRLLGAEAPEAAARLARLRYNRLAVVHLQAEGPPVPDFGFQVAFGEGLETRGVTYNDGLFGRDGIVTAYLGGAKNPRLPDWPDERIRAVAEAEFRRMTGRRAEALEVSRPSVPAYDRSWSALDGLELRPGLRLCAGYVERAGIGGRLAQAAEVVRGLTGA